MMTSADLQELQFFHRLLYTGSWQELILEPVDDLPPNVQNEARLIQARAFIASNEANEAKESDLERYSSDSKTLELLLMISKLVRSKVEQDKIVPQLDQIASDDRFIQVPSQAVLLASGFLLVEKIDSAMSVLNPHLGSHCESSLLLILCHLLMHDEKAAQTYLAKLKKISNDDFLIQVAEAWIGLKTHSSKEAESSNQFYDETNITASSSLGSTAAAVSFLLLGKKDLALETLEEPVSEDKTFDHDRLANRIVASVHNGIHHSKIEKMINELKDKESSHPLLEDFKNKSRLFDELASSITS